MTIVKKPDREGDRSQKLRKLKSKPILRDMAGGHGMWWGGPCIVQSAWLITELILLSVWTLEAGEMAGEARVYASPSSYCPGCGKKRTNNKT